jgi:hypothetical protein
MKQLNWTKIPNNKVVSSYWKDVTEVGIEIDSNEVELLFAAREDKKGAHHCTQHSTRTTTRLTILSALAGAEIMGPGDAGTKKKETNVTLLDPKRANNCGTRSVAGRVCSALLFILRWLALLLGGTAIALSRFKMSNEDIKQAILRLDESKLSAESVEVRPPLLHSHAFDIRAHTHSEKLLV